MLNMQIQNACRARRGERGVTLIELIMVITILVVVSSLILANNARFGGEVLLQNFAYDVALSIRKAQVYGIAVRRSEDGDFNVGYGVHFDSRNMQTEYILFVDKGDGVYTDQSEILERTSILGGFKIVKLCAISAGSLSGECERVDTLDIFFKRPEPSAFISANGKSGIRNPADLQERGGIDLRSPRGQSIRVFVEVAGQIAVERI